MSSARGFCKLDADSPGRICSW